MELCSNAALQQYNLEIQDDIKDLTEKDDFCNLKTYIGNSWWIVEHLHQILFVSCFSWSTIS